MNLKSEALGLNFKMAGLTEAGVFEGYGAVFGNIDSWDDIIVPGAFAKTLAEHEAKGKKPKLLWQHDRKEIIGAWEAIQEDQNGLFVKGRLFKDEIARAREAYVLLKSGELDSLSIGFYARDYSVDEKTWIRTIKEVELKEISLVTFPANEDARVSAVKAAGRVKTIRQFEDFLRDAGGFSAKEAKAIASAGFKARDVPELAPEAAAILDDLIKRYT